MTQDILPQAVGDQPTMTKEKSGDGLYKSVGELGNLLAFLFYLADEGNDRLTINQAIFFLSVAASDLKGAPMTLTEIMERGEGVLTKSLKTTYKVLLPPTRGYSSIALGWIDREPDPDDERKKYLRLTAKGRKVIEAALLAAGLRR